MDQLKKKYFCDQTKIIFLRKGEHLFHKGEQNNRLYLLESGKVKGFDPEDQGEYFEVDRGDFIGLNSFFSFVSTTRMSVIALEDSVLPFINKDEHEPKQLANDFMPAVVYMLIKRQEQAYQDNLKHQQVLKEMQEVERLASLGQLSAGVAHELNNAITVISRGSEHIIEEVLEQLKCNPLELEMIKAGLIKGRTVSSAEARKKAKELKGTPSFSDAKLRDYARTGMAEKLIKEDLEIAQRAFELWNLGASLHDLQLAVKQSEHVISSMRSLASTNVVRQLGCDINESVQKALFLLSNPVKNVNLTLELNEIPTVYGNSGELVQIWTNIIKNAIDAMHGIPQKNASLLIRSEPAPDHVKVIIKDAGPGIPDEMIEEIFKPHVTTKKEGQTFGLGLGLTIVQKIIKRYAGELLVDSTPAGTQFTVKIPIGENI